tara:strand:+ start:638 stop:973 length:336 start_codon:yes stop_codon:yes gene_type:complete
MSQLTSTAIKEFKTGFAGSVLLPDNPQYDEVRQIWNAMIDRRPSMVARCTSPADVVHALNFVRQHNAPFSIRGGGHNIAFAYGASYERLMAIKKQYDLENLFRINQNIRPA